MSKCLPQGLVWLFIAVLNNDFRKNQHIFL